MMEAYWLESQTSLSCEQLNQQGVPYEFIPVSAYRDRLDEWMEQRSYTAEDEVKLTPKTPNLTTILQKFAAEHRHTDDEVRYIVSGAGIFDIRSPDDQWMRIKVVAGDFIIVPANVNHRFTLSEENNIHAVRLFKDNPAWEPLYRKKHDD